MLTLYVSIAAMLFLVYLRSGYERQVSIRCVACGARAGERHHRDCHYKDR